MNRRRYLRPQDLNPSLPSPPVAPARPQLRTIHGETLTDEYAWLRDPGYPEVTNPEILNYLHEENRYFESAFQPHVGLVDGIFNEIRGRIQEDERSVPVRDGDWVFQWRFTAGDEYRQHYRKPATGGDWQLILDEPALADGLDYFHVGGMDMTRDGKLLAYSVDTDGSERYRMRVKDPASGVLLPDEIPGTIGDPVWLPDGRTFLYAELSREWRPYRIRAHVVGSEPTDDPILYEEPDTGFFAGVELSQDRAFILIGTGDHVTSEVRALPIHEPHGEALVIARRRTGHEYEVDHAGDRFFIRTNDVHQNFRLVAVSDNAAPDTRWEEVLPASDDSYVRGFTAFASFLAVEERSDAVDRLRILSYDGSSHHVSFPETVFEAHLGDNREFHAQSLQLRYQSMVTPPTVFDYHVRERRLERRKVQEIPSGYEASQYATERIQAPARDGESIPISIVYRKDFPKDGSRFVHLTGYGAYGYGRPPAFSLAALSLLHRGFAVAIAHVRGGDERGYRWYENGKLMKRKNTFNDFVDAAQQLIREGWTQAGRICISGGSAGGELMGAVLNMAPELWRAAVAQVPFVDVLNTMLDESLPLTPMEWPEWGNPIESREAFDYIRSYSPYDNVRAQDYPPVLVTAGLSDPRVTYWEPAKWTARLRAAKTDENVVLLKTNMGAGHAGKSGRFQHIRETAEMYAFFLLAARLANGAPM